MSTKLSRKVPEISVIDLIQEAEALVSSNQAPAAVDLYRDWISQQNPTHLPPALYVAYFNLGVIQADLQDNISAEKSYRAALSLLPRFVQAHLNLGTVLERMSRFDEALTEWRTALMHINPLAAAEKPLRIHALNNLGRLLEIREDYSQGLRMLTDSLTIDPKQPEALAHWVHLRQKLCEWPAFRPFAGASIEDLKESASALALLSETDSPEEQLAAARRYVAKKVLPLQPQMAPVNGYAHRRLRVGYLSSDFCNHAVFILTDELYALHDRSLVDVYGFSWGPEDTSPLHARVTSAMDHYIRIHDKTDMEAAQCIRDQEIDILVDLHGLTMGARHNILSWRPAPVQVAYLGFPGTTALPAIDYVIADEFVFPDKLVPFFSEKPLYLPDSFQINGRQRTIGPRPTRQSCKLPEDAFVFCCFNSAFKITPEIFSAWLQILQRAPHSVLWLIADHDAARINLANAAVERGVDPARLIFADRVDPENHLARYQVADLFLDTYPFNAGTTASESLWAGLPILTLAGETFASRMAGSLLHAVDLPELVTYTIEQYIEAGVSLALQPEGTALHKQKLHDNRSGSTLFDSPRLVRALEEQFLKIAKRPQATDDSGKQTPITRIQNADMLDLMRPDYRRVIEVGSSSGALAQAYRAINPDTRYTSIEIGRDDAEASQTPCTDVVYGNIESLSDEIFQTFADGDCWIFANTLEHVNDPWNLLKKIRGTAAGPLEIVACIHNAQNWSLQTTLNNGTFAYQDAGLLNRAHIRWFTRNTIIQLFESAGFRIVAMTARTVQSPSTEVTAAIRSMAIATGSNADMAVQDSVAFQYVVKAVSAAP